jgi:hypothetical protein
MNRLIKAEFYRIRKSTKFTMWILLVTFLTFIIPVLTLTLSPEKPEYNITNFVQCYMSNSGTLTYMLVPMLAAIVAVMPYDYKTSNYMVITGNSIHKILVSNIVTVFVSVMLPIAAAFAVLTVIFYLIGGRGDMSGGELIRNSVLVFIGLTHLIIVSEMIAGVVRHIAAAGAVLVRWMVVDMVIPMGLYFLLDDGGHVVENSYNWLASTVFTNEEKAFEAAYNKLILCQLLALVIEVALWYVISCIRHRKRNY